MLTQVYSFINVYSGKFLKQNKWSPYEQLRLPHFQTEFPITSHCSASERKVWLSIVGLDLANLLSECDTTLRVT